MDSSASELTGCEAGGREHERQRVSAYHAFRRPCDVREVECECAELTDVLPSEELFERQPGESEHVSAAGDVRYAGGCQSGDAIECYVATRKFDRETGIHCDGYRDLVCRGVADGNGANGSGDS